MNELRKFSFVFVCQSGDLEVKALLLAASLRKNLRCEHELVAAIPGPVGSWGKPANATLSLLKRMGVRLVDIENGVDPSFSHANKISCMAIATEADKRVFLDTDMLCLRPFRDESRFGAAISCKPADLQTFSSDEADWARVYETVGVPMPDERIAATSSQELGPPYFNSGFIAIDRDLPLAAKWLDFARKIFANEAISSRRLWSDQVSFPPALAALKLRCDCLDERYNHPTHLKSIDPDALPFFSHYHWPAIILKEPPLRELVSDLIAEFPEILAVMRSQAEWCELADCLLEWQREPVPTLA
jgi:hypothetical protein